MQAVRKDLFPLYCWGPIITILPDISLTLLPPQVASKCKTSRNLIITVILMTDVPLPSLHHTEFDILSLLARPRRNG